MTAEEPPEYTEGYGVVAFEQDGEEGYAQSVTAVRADPAEGSAEIVRLPESTRVDGRKDASGSGEQIGLVYSGGFIGEGMVDVEMVYYHEDSGEWWTVPTGEIEVKDAI